MSQGATREICGFLCRWGLLAGAGAFVALVAWAGLTATMGLAGDVGSSFLLKDCLSAPAGRTSRDVVLRGYLTPRASVGGVAVGLVIVEGRPLQALCTYEQGCATVLANPQPGSLRLLVRGIPYGALAFRAGEAHLLCAGSGQRVFLVDGRLVAAADGGGPDVWRDVLGRMRECGQVALFHPGPREAFLECWPRLREADPRTPILFDDRRPAATYTLVQAAKRLDRNRRRSSVDVITAAPDLARRAAGLEFSTHLLLAGPEVPGRTPHLRCYRSAAKLKDSLLP